MPRDTIYSPKRRAVSSTMTLPAPTGGINARDSLAMMKPNEAIDMVNFYPLQYGVRVRKGYRQWTVGLPGDVETLITHHGADGNEQMFACVGSSIFDVSVSNVLGSNKSFSDGFSTGFQITDVTGAPVPMVTGFSSARWQYTSMTNEFGTFTIAVNGQDVPQVYNGSVWAPLTITAGVAYPSFDPKLFINVVIAHRRLWFVQRDSGDAWYLPVDVIQGEVKRFGVGELFARGGFLQAMNTWATESGAGMKDNTVFVSSEGDIAIFSGYDPDDITLFQLAGTYQIGATFNRRCLLKYGSDLWVLCEDGIFPLSGLLGQSKVLMAGAVTDIIQLRLSDDVTNFSSNFGWEMLVVNRHQLVMLNVPVTGAPNEQWVMNQVTQAWTTFQGYAAICLGLRNNEPYFGGSGAVSQAWYGNLDNYTPLGGGSSIVASCQQAYNYFGQPAQQKRWTMLRPIFNAGGVPGVVIGLNVNFNVAPTTVTAPPAYAQLPGSEWDVSLWDSGLWGGGLQNVSNWYSANSLGFAAAPFLKTQSSFDTFWIATDFVSEQGGVL